MTFHETKLVNPGVPPGTMNSPATSVKPVTALATLGGETAWSSSEAIAILGAVRRPPFLSDQNTTPEPA